MQPLSEVLDTALATKTDIRTVRDDVVKVERRMDAVDAKLDKLQWRVGIVIALAEANFVKQYFLAYFWLPALAELALTAIFSVVSSLSSVMASIPSQLTMEFSFDKVKSAGKLMR